jgi:rubredoxin
MAAWTCPVCGYPSLTSMAYAQLGNPPFPEFGTPPYAPRLGMPSYEVCACCGYEFGFDDEPGTGPGTSFREYLREWLANGANWFDASKRPDGWDLQDQLSAAGIARPSP